MVKRGLQGFSEKPKAGSQHVFAQTEGIDQSAWVVPIERIIPDPDQPRRHFDEQSLQDLAADIKRRGIRSPITVQRKGSNFHLIAGERRLRAAKLAGLSDMPVRVIEPENVLEEQLIENLQREDLNPVDEAIAIGRLRDEYKLTYRDLAARLNKSKSTIENILKILEMPKSLQDQLRAGEINRHQAELKTQSPKKKVRKTKAPSYSYKTNKDGSFRLAVHFIPERSNKQDLIEKLEQLLRALRDV